MKLLWGDGEEFNFLLGEREFQTLELLCDCAIGVLAKRIFKFEFSHNDIMSIIQQGLEGGGMTPVQARDTMRRFVYGRPLFGRDGDLTSPVNTAVAVFSAGWYGEKVEGDGNDNGG